MVFLPITQLVRSYLKLLKIGHLHYEIVILLMLCILISPKPLIRLVIQNYYISYVHMVLVITLSILFQVFLLVVFKE